MTKLCKERRLLCATNEINWLLLLIHNNNKTISFDDTYFNIHKITIFEDLEYMNILPLDGWLARVELMRPEMS